MTLVLKVPLKNAEDAKKIILSRGILDKNFRIKKDSEFICFPILKKTEGFPENYFIDEKLERIEKKKTFKERLEEILTKKEMERIKTSYVTVGNVAIIEIDRKLRKKEREIARVLLETNKSLKAVFRKGKHFGEYRRPRLKWLFGDKNSEVIHRESGVQIKLDIKKVYFSTRLSSERLRIAGEVKKGERVLVMFSGCAPFPLVISKHSKAKEIYGIEKNKIAHKYAIENLRLNRIKNIKLYLGDVRKIVPRLKIKFDRIVMPRPKIKESFLDIALSAIKKRGIVNFYDFVKEDEIFESVNRKIMAACKKKKKKCSILRIVKCGQPARRTLRVCADFVVF